MSKTRNLDALIRIEDAFKVLCWEKCYPGALCPDNYCAEIWDEFEDVERVDAVPVRHGRWKTVEDWDGDEHYQCSVCGAEFVLIDGDPDDNDYLYCPHCGAKMDGKDGEHHERNAR